MDPRLTAIGFVLAMIVYGTMGLAVGAVLALGWVKRRQGKG